jgi:hypothetical protein
MDQTDVDCRTVESDAVAEISWKPGLKHLGVRLHNGLVYFYAGVPEAVYQEFLAAESKGRFWNHVIKKQYGMVPVERHRECNEIPTTQGDDEPTPTRDTSDFMTPESQNCGMSE